MSSTQDAEFKAGLKEAYMILSHVALMSNFERGGVMEGFSSNGTNKSFNYLEKYIQFQAVTRTNSLEYWHETGEWYDMSGKPMDNTEGSRFDNTVTGVLSNGMLIASRRPLSCTYVYGGVNACGIYHIDVNGKKGPNTYGKDIYVLYITDKAIVAPPEDPGWRCNGNNEMCNCTTNGAACARYIIMDQPYP